MKVKDIFEVFIPRDGAINERDADHEVRIVVHAPGSLGGTPSVGLSARGLRVGFDWDDGKLLLNPDVPLTRLTPEDVAAIHESVKKGQSWHAYQAHKQVREKHSEQVQQLKAEIDRLTRERDQLKVNVDALLCDCPEYSDVERLCHVLGYLGYSTPSGGEASARWLSLVKELIGAVETSELLRRDKEAVAEYRQLKAENSELRSVGEQAWMALVGYLPAHQNEVTKAAIDRCMEVLGTKAKDQQP